jgi:Tol biopolymer transport system component
MAVLMLAAGAFAGTTEIVSVSSSGNQGDSFSTFPSISADGRYVAFESNATNLSPETAPLLSVFVHDLATGITEMVSAEATSRDLNYAAAISADGRHVAYTYWGPGGFGGVATILVHDRVTGLTEPASVDSSGVQANDYSTNASISADGRYVAFESDATNLVAGDANLTRDIFVRDRAAGLTERVSVDSSGNEAVGASYAPSISADGRYVAFESDAANLVPGDTNNVSDIFVHDRATGSTERVSVDSNGNQGNGPSGISSISADGRYVAFESTASNLVPGDTNNVSDIFVHDRATGLTERVSVDSNGVQAGGASYTPSISADGMQVAFESTAANLVPGDTNGFGDVFVHDRATGSTERVSVANGGVQSDGNSANASISADGKVAFSSFATNLVPGDTNGFGDVFVHNMYEDLDNDGYSIATDCNDSDPAINPGAAEIPYNGVDENCNGMADDDDLDNDTYGIAADCNDSDPAINPAACDIKRDGIDQDCDGVDRTKGPPCK